MAKTKSKTAGNSVFIAGRRTPDCASGNSVWLGHYDNEVGPNMQNPPQRDDFVGNRSMRQRNQRLSPMNKDIAQ